MSDLVEEAEAIADISRVFARLRPPSRINVLDYFIVRIDAPEPEVAPTPAPIAGVKAKIVEKLNGKSPSRAAPALPAAPTAPTLSDRRPLPEDPPWARAFRVVEAAGRACNAEFVRTRLGCSPESATHDLDAGVAAGMLQRIGECYGPVEDVEAAPASSIRSETGPLPARVPGETTVQFGQRVSDETLAFLRERGPVTASEVAARFRFTSDWTSTVRLRKLLELGLVETVPDSKPIRWRATSEVESDVG